MQKIRVMVVDDSVLIRKILTDLLGADPEIEVIGTSSNGKIALARIPQINPDVITLDIEMPEMDGLTALSEIRKIYPRLPVIMCSTLSVSGGQSTLDALSRGASDYVTKPSNTTSKEEAFKKLGDDLIPKIKALTRRAGLRPAPVFRAPVGAPGGFGRIEAVAIGTSTGGPNALTEVIPLIPADFPVPVFIVQHMPPIFTGLLAERLTSKSKIVIKEAAEGDEIVPGRAWVAPGNFHMTVHRQGLKGVIRLNQEPPENSCRPAVDVLFRSVADMYGKNVLSVIMTGMGQDGLRGCQRMREAGGQIIVQDEATSVVWGMPGAVANAGLAEKILPLSQIGPEIVQRVTLSRMLTK